MDATSRDAPAPAVGSGIEQLAELEDRIGALCDRLARIHSRVVNLRVGLGLHTSEFAGDKPGTSEGEGVIPCLRKRVDEARNIAINIESELDPIDGRATTCATSQVKDLTLAGKRSF